MSTAQIAELLANLGRLRIRLWVEGEHLRFQAPQGALTPELKAALLAHKRALLEILRVPHAQPASARRDRQALVRINTGGDRTPFFCVHPVGGNVFCYARLARHLSVERPFYALQSPAHDFDSLESMAGHYLNCVRSVQPQGPYLLGGWSMGGVIAFEMTAQLRRNGCSAEVFLIDSIAPGVHLNHQLPDDRMLLPYFVRDLEGIMGRPLNISLEALQVLGPEQRMRAIAELVCKQRMVPPELGADELIGLFQSFRNNLSALLNYRPSPYAGRVSLIRSSGTRSEQNDPALGWSRLVAELEMYEIEGDHYSVITGPEVARLADLLEEKFASLSNLGSRMEQQGITL